MEQEPRLVRRIAQDQGKMPSSAFRSVERVGHLSRTPEEETAGSKKSTRDALGEYVIHFVVARSYRGAAKPAAALVTV